MEEYQAVKNNLKLNKAPGPDGIPPEVFKHCDIDQIILDFANDVLENCRKPKQWSENNIKTLPKSGDLSLTGNYRGISLSCIAAKITNKMILNRVQPAIEPHLRTNQNGFRPKRSTASHILALRRLIEGVKQKNLEAAIVFVDFRKAFDTIHRGKMMKILLAYGIPKKIVDAIRVLYDNTRARIISPDGETEEFEIVAGVLQGDTLAPYLFAIVLDYAMRKAINGFEEELGFKLVKRRSRRTAPVTITDTGFADDIALISEGLAQAQKMLTRVETEAAKIGLHMNAKKTQVMPFNQEDVNFILKSISGDTIAAVEDYLYLGAWMSSSDQDIHVRKALAWSACNKLSKIWKSDLSRYIKVRLFRAIVESILLYGSETWTLTKELTKRLDGTYTRMLRCALNISWKSHTTNEVLYGNIPKLSETIAARRLRLAGHCVRHPELEAAKLVLWAPQQGRSNRGRKRTDYIDALKADTGLSTLEDLRSSMLDRDVWKEFVADVRADARP